MTFVRAISAELGPTARPRRPGMASRFTRDFFSQSSFATHAVATGRNVTKVDPSLPLKSVAPLGCGIQTRAGPVLNALRPEAGTIFGTGSVGLAAVMAAQVADCTTSIGVDVQPGHVIRAEELGATGRGQRQYSGDGRSDQAKPLLGRAWTSASTRPGLRMS